MNGYLIPANAKKGTLIFNVFRPFDLILFGSGIGVTVILLTLLQNANIILTLIAILPAAITGLLVFPIPNYHNVLCAIISIYKFYTGRRNYIWRGWCFNEQFASDDKQSKNSNK